MDNTFKVTQVKKVNSSVGCLAHSEYQSLLVTLNENFRVIEFLKLGKSTSNLQKVSTSPLTNEGLVCAGGYSTEQGCFVVNGQTTNNYYGDAEK